jgi:hypothetical protein
MTHPKNNEYVAKHRQKAREDMGDEAYRKKEAEARALRRRKAKEAKEVKEPKKDLKAEQDLKTKINTINYVNDLLNTLFPKVINAIPEKRKVGRPKKPRNPIGRPPGSKNKPK